jgi:hypothetical protein
MPEHTALQTLAGLLQSGGAKPLVNANRLAPSAIYDLHYRLFIVAAAFELHSKPYVLGRRRISTVRLKLLQFVAIRPWLVPVIRNWSETQGYAQQSVFSPHQLRRGFLGDEMHDNVVAFLVARGVFLWMPIHLASGPNADLLNQIYSAGVEEELFSTAIHSLRELSEIQITNSMLEGW